MTSPLADKSGFCLAVLGPSPARKLAGEIGLLAAPGPSTSRRTNYKTTRVVLEYDGRSGRSPRSCRIRGPVRRPGGPSTLVGRVLVDKYFAVYSGLWCGREDSNLHEFYLTRSLV